MPGAETILFDYIPRNPFAKAKKVSAYDEHFEVATISKIVQSFKHVIKIEYLVLQKFSKILQHNFLIQNTIILHQNVQLLQVAKWTKKANSTANIVIKAITVSCEAINPFQQLHYAQLKYINCIAIATTY